MDPSDLAIATGLTLAKSRSKAAAASSPLLRTDLLLLLPLFCALVTFKSNHQVVSADGERKSERLVIRFQSDFGRISTESHSAAGLMGLLTLIQEKR